MVISSLPKVIQPAARRKYKLAVYVLIREYSSTIPEQTSYLCELASISRASYYKWLHRKTTAHELKDAEILSLIREINTELNSLFGYRNMTLYMHNEYGKDYKKKRVYRIMATNGIQSSYRHKPHSTWRRSKPEETAKNLLGRDFFAEGPNQKWCSDVTEVKAPHVKQKAYVNTIIDLYDRYPVGVVVSQHNDVKQLNDSFFMAMTMNKEAHPLFHSDRGFQYTRRVFSTKLETYGITQSMSRVGHCIDNGPMESFQGILKDILRILHPEIHSYNELVQAIYATYDFYINKYPQRRFHGKTAGQVRREALAAQYPEQYPIPKNPKIIKYWETIEQKKQMTI